MASAISSLSESARPDLTREVTLGWCVPARSATAADVMTASSHGDKRLLLYAKLRLALKALRMTKWHRCAPAFQNNDRFLQFRYQDFLAKRTLL